MMRKIGAAATGTKPDGTPYYTFPAIVDTSRCTADGGPRLFPIHGPSQSTSMKRIHTHRPHAPLLFPVGAMALQK